jgi:hypothetical protein
MSFLAILDTALCVVMLGFNGWNWYLAMTGFTTIEFMGTMSRGDDGARYDFNFHSVRDNLYKTFGTQNLIAVFSPSLRNVPFSGIEWSYQMRDMGFNEKGVLTRESVIEEGNRRAREEIEMAEISTTDRTTRTRQDTSLDFLDQEIEI